MKTTILLLGVLFLACILSVGAAIFSRSLEYNAQADFTVNWNQIWDGEENFDVQQARQEYDVNLANLKVSQPFISLLRQHCDLTAKASRSLPDDLRRNLNITRIGSVKGDDLYRIHYADDNRDVARKVVTLLRKRLVEKLNNQAHAQAGLNSIKSLNEYGSARDDADKNSSELAAQLQQQNQEYSAERQTSVDDLKKQSEMDDVKIGTTGLTTFIHAVAVFSDPAKIHGRAMITKS